MTTQTERRLRLFGPRKGQPDRFGGGMPLPSIVMQMLNHVQDNGPTEIPELVGLVEARHHKRERVEYIYKKGHKLQGDAYELFIRDLIAELIAAGVGVVDDDRLTFGPEFKLSAPLPLLSGMGATIYDKQIRELLDRAAHQELEIKALAHDLMPDRPGIRAINPKNLADITESMRRGGFNPLFPILRDTRGRVLSGRHRYLAAKSLGIPESEMPGWDKPIKVTDYEAVDIAIKANIASGFTKSDIERLARRIAAADPDLLSVLDLIGAAGEYLGNRTKVWRELLADPDQSARAIARKTGVPHGTVDNIMREIRAGAQLSGHLPELPDFVTGEDGKTYPRQRQMRPRSNGAAEQSPPPEPEPEPEPQPEPVAAREPAPPPETEDDRQQRLADRILELGAKLTPDRRHAIARKWLADDSRLP